MRKLFADMRVAGLGAAAGLLSASIFLMLARIDTYYQYLEEGGEREAYSFIEDLWWLPVSFWHVVLSIVASLMAHRYLVTRSSPFLLWQIIGVIVLMAWALSFGVGFGLDCIRTGSVDAIERFLSQNNPWFLAKYVSTVFACHVLYGSAMQAASRQYLPQDASLQLTNEICSPVDRLQTVPNNLDLLHISRSVHD